MTQRLTALTRPLPTGLQCARCGIEAPATTRRGTTAWRCQDCKDVECSKGHPWPEEPKRDQRGNRRCTRCENERRRGKNTTRASRRKAAA